MGILRFRAYFCLVCMPHLISAGFFQKLCCCFTEAKQQSLLRHEFPLNAAVDEGSAEDITFLLQQPGIQGLDDPDHTGLTPLMEAIYQRKTVMVDALLTAGARPDLRTSIDRTPLLQAIPEFPTFGRRRHTEHQIIHSLIEHKAPIDSMGEYGYMIKTTPLKKAIIFRRNDIVKILLESKANPNYCGSTTTSPLNRSCAENNHIAMQMLLARDVLLDENDYNFQLFFEYVALNQHVERCYQTWSKQKQCEFVYQLQKTITPFPQPLLALIATYIY